ncbi:hypothetical protein MVEN_01572800 [Mycena venus]|uniref:DUF6589 domain-containing protein n=1 Tax=Mycena venus TaxID=2733690 RepID=A0A8H6XS18_9AGAR|nr:hypothetical protein MVEN_01572800 [Mycena venus]
MITFLNSPAISPRHLGNRWTVFSSDIDNDEPADDQLPPSDPPDRSENDSSESDGQETPIQSMPALTSLLGITNDTESAPALDSSSSPPAPIHRPSHCGSSVPPADSPDNIDLHTEHPTSNDILWSPQKEALILCQWREVQCQQSRVTNRVERANAAELERQEAERRQDLAKELEEAKKRIRRNQIFDKFLAEMQDNNILLADFLDHNTVERIFGYWTTSKYNDTTHAFIHNLATNYVSRAASTESRSITQSGILNKTKKAINERFFLDFSLADLVRTIRGMAPMVFKIFDSFLTTTRQLNQASEKFLQKKELMKGTAVLTLLHGASQNNNYAQSVNDMFLTATGAQRQHFPILGIYGFSIGYTSIISNVPKTVNDCTAEKDASTDPMDDLDEIDDAPGVPACNKQKKKGSKKKRKHVRGPGLFSMLWDACMTTCQLVTQSGLELITYDNINLMNRIAEQVLGVQENGTCATLIPLHKAKLEHLQTANLNTSILNALPLTLNDIILNNADSKFFTKNMVHTILQIIVLHGGEGFERWRKDLDVSQPVSADIIEVHKMALHPLPLMEIDESSITGNVQVIEEIMCVLGFNPDNPDFGKYVQIIMGDQLTIASQCSILNIADCHGVLETHFGKPAAGVRSPSSLGFHNTVLDRLPITLTSLPLFRTCRDLIMVSLYTCVLHCLLLVSGHDSLNQCASSIENWDTLVNYAEKIYTTYADTDRVQELRERQIPEERKRDADAKATKKQQLTAETSKQDLPRIHKGDMSRCGDSGHVVIILWLWVFSYRGNRRTKYAHKMLHVLHNLICVWMAELRGIVLQNWLANPQGKFNSFMEIDLVQEHLNFWIKKIYKADGVGHSWDWLVLVSPCIDILWQLATQMNVELGTQQGSKHATPDLTDNIATLMASLDEHEVYVEKEGRVLDDDEKPAPDVILVGMAALSHSVSTTPLAEFNQQFDILREWRRLTPVTDLLGLINTSGIPQPPATVNTDIPAADASAEADENDEFADLPDLEPPADSDEEEEEEVGAEEDLFVESPTLTRFDEGDVELDMDNIPEWYLDEDDKEYVDTDSDGDLDA